MRNIQYMTTWWVFLYGGFPAHVDASDLHKEKRWADQIVESIMVGEAQWLNAKAFKFLSIYTESSHKKVLGGAIIMHGIGAHPNWQDVIYPLRSRLPEAGWHTLSIQMPILANDASYAQYAALFSEIAPRINAAIAFYKEKGINNIVLIGHSLGSTMAAYYLANNPQNKIAALVAVGVSLILFKDNERDYLNALQKLHMPIFDIYGGEDRPDIIATALEKRKTAKKAGNKHYTQLKVAGANHLFAGKEDELVKHISAWLAGVANVTKRNVD